MIASRAAGDSTRQTQFCVCREPAPMTRRKVVFARNTKREKLIKGEPAPVRNLQVHVLRAGMKFHFEE